MGFSRFSQYYAPSVRLALLLAVSAGVTLILPRGVSLLYFLAMLILFFFSKTNPDWFAFMFVIVNRPAGLFATSVYSTIGMMPTLTFMRGFSFSIEDLFYIVALVKALSIKRRNESKFSNIIIVLVCYFVVLVVQSFVLGMNLPGTVRLFKLVIAWTLVFSVPKLMPHSGDYERFFHLLILPMLFSAAVQIMELLTGATLPGVLSGTASLELRSIGRAYDTVGMARPEVAAHLNLIVFIGALYTTTIESARKSYLLYSILLSVCMLSIFITATRGWILGYAIGFIAWILIYGSSKRNMVLSDQLIILVIIAATVFVSTNISGNIKNQIFNVVLRVKTMEDIPTGDLAASGGRLGPVSDQVLDKFMENPITGWGFSYRGEHNGHVGNQNLLQSAGIIGFALFVAFIFRNFAVIFRSYRARKGKHSQSNPILVFACMLLTILFIHSTSGQIYGFDPMFIFGTSIFTLVIFHAWIDKLAQEV